MSRVGKQTIELPAGTTISTSDGVLSVKGKNGELSRALDRAVTVNVSDNQVTVSVADEDNKAQRALWGTFASHVKNMVQGVSEGFEKKLEVNGVGYRVSLQGNDLKLEVGFSHPVLFPLPDGVKAAVEKNLITLSSIDKELLGDTAAKIRAIRKPEPYKGKGIKYSDEVIRRKAGKTAAKAA